MSPWMLRSLSSFSLWIRWYVVPLAKVHEHMLPTLRFLRIQVSSCLDIFESWSGYRYSCTFIYTYWFGTQPELISQVVQVELVLGEPLAPEFWLLAVTISMKPEVVHVSPSYTIHMQVYSIHITMFVLCFGWSKHTCLSFEALLKKTAAAMNWTALDSFPCLIDNKKERLWADTAHPLFPFMDWESQDQTFGDRWILRALRGWIARWNLSGFMLRSERIH